MRMLRLLAVVALAACAATQSLPARGQGFVPDPRRSAPVPDSATYDCFPFFPDSDGHAQDIAAVQHFLEQKHGAGLAYWQGITLQQDMLMRLNEGRVPSSTKPITLQWEITLYAHCQMLNDSMMPPGTSYRYIEWLEDQYEKTISIFPANAGTVQQCQMGAPLTQRAIRMWLAWNLFNNRLYGEAEKLAEDIEKNTRSTAEHLQRTLGAVPILQPASNYQKQICQVLGHGPLNDAAAALWVKAMSFYCTGQDPMADSIFAELRSRYSKGRVYDRSNGWFWDPADPGTDKTCP